MIISVPLHGYPTCTIPQVQINRSMVIFNVSYTAQKVFLFILAGDKGPVAGSLGRVSPVLYMV